MARLKFLLFAVVSLGLWAYHLTLIAPMGLSGAVERAQSSVAAAVGPLAVAIESKRSLTQLIALKLGASSAVTNAKAGAKPEVPTAERLASVRAAAADGLSPDIAEQLFLALANEAGAVAAKGSAAPATALPEGLELAAVNDAGSTGLIRAIEGVDYLVLSVPLWVSDRNEVRQNGKALIGLPLLPDAKLLDDTVRGLGLMSLALVSEGKAAVQAGDRAGVDAILTGIKSSSTGVLASGTVRELGPLKLPMMTDSLTQAVASRQAIGGTTFEVVASASVRPALEALAAYQVFALGSLVGLALLALVVTLVLGADERGVAMVAPPPVPVPSVGRRDEAAAKAPLAMTPAAPAPEASPDDFHFPPPVQSSPSSLKAAPPAPPPPSLDEPSADPFESSAPPFSSAPPVEPEFSPGPEEEVPRTVAYPAFKPGAPPPENGAPAFNFPPQNEPEPGEDNPEATRVAVVPAELINAARAAGNTSERAVLKVTGAGMPAVAAIPPAASSDEERHFQDVFRDFVSTREKCGEPADGLTFEKFKAKLLKNKDQLVAKYQCRSVRFQVYVKDGKAALKATPVKD